MQGEKVSEKSGGGAAEENRSERSREGLSGARWQEVKATLQPLRPDLTELSSGWAVLFLLSLRGDLSQLPSDLQRVKPQ